MDTFGPIDPELTGLAHPAPARATPFLVEGGSRWIRGVESRPGFTIGRGSTSVVSVNVPGLGTAANVLLFPGIVRRDFAGRDGGLVETLLVASTMPLSVAEWRVGSGRVPGHVALELAGPGGEVVDQESSRIVIARGDHRVGLVLSSADASWSVESRSQEPLRVIVEPEGSGPLSIAVAFGGADDVRRGLAAARHANAHAVRAAAGPESGLLLGTGVPEIDDGFRWLRSRLAGQIHRSVDRGVIGNAARSGPGATALAVGGTALDRGVAALGVGDRESADLLVSGRPGSSPHQTLLAARFASVFGGTGAASAIAGAWTSDRSETAGAHSGPLTRLALEELAEALHGAADPGTLATLRRLANESRTASKGAGTERRLPMTGRDAASVADRSGWIARLLEGDPTPPAPSHDRAVIVDARTATARFATNPDEAWVQWRRLLAEPMGGDGPSVLWDAEHLSGDGAAGSPTEAGSLTAELLIAVAYGLLGLRPDAGAGRIRIAPRMPSHVTAFEAGGIPVGASTIGLRYTRAKGALRYELSPEVAQVPPLVVLEPSVSGSVRSVRVDGEAAELDLRSAGGRTVVPVQLPLDGVRTLEIETEG